MNENMEPIEGLTGNTIKSEALAGVLAFTAGLVVTLLLIGMVSGTPLVALADFFTGVWSSSVYIGNLLNTASLFMWAALGACLALASGSLNLGGEGQIYVSGFVAALVLFYGGECGLPAFVTVGFAGIAAVSAGVLSVEFFDFSLGFGAVLPARTRAFVTSYMYIFAWEYLHHL